VGAFEKTVLKRVVVIIQKSVPSMTAVLNFSANKKATYGCKWLFAEVLKYPGLFLNTIYIETK